MNQFVPSRVARRTLCSLCLIGVLAILAGAAQAASPAADPALAVLKMTGPATPLRPGEPVQGEVILAAPATKDTTVVVQWRDSYSRIGGRREHVVKAGEDRFGYSMVLADPIARRGRVEVVVDGATQLQHVPLRVILPVPSWDDYIAFVWARYPYGGYYEALLDYGINGEHVGRHSDGEWVKDHNFAFYVDQLGYEVFAYYHKFRGHWDSIMEQYAKDPRNVQLLHRVNSLSNPLSFAMLDDLYSQAVSRHANDRPMFYNLADEIGFGDQSGTNDFCWDYPSRDYFRDTLMAMYGTLENLNKEWGTSYASWAEVRSVQPSTYWMYDRLHRDIYLPRDFQVASSDRVMRTFGTVFRSFGDMVSLYGDLRTSEPVDVAYVQAQLTGRDAGKDVSGEIAAINAKYGSAFHDYEGIVRFYKAYDEWSFGLKVDRDDAEAMKGWNLAPWLDFREIMDRQMAEAMAKAVEIGKRYDPQGRFGFTGTHHPGVFSGHNYAKLCPLVDIIVPYNIGNTPEIIRSLNPQTCYQVLPSWQSGNKGVRDIWTRALHGDRGMIFWDNDEPRNKFLSRPDKQPTERAKALGPALVELESGLGKQLIASRRDNNGIAVCYSHASIRVDYWRQHLDKGRKWVEMRSPIMYRRSERNVLRASWYRLIEDLNLQYDVVSSEQIRGGRLVRDGYKMLILPEVMAMSAAEAEQVRRFHAAGGTVIADRFCGIMDEHGKWLDTPWLADLWGQERAHLLNRAINGYSALRMTPGREAELRDFVGSYIAKAGIEPAIRVISTRTNAPLSAAEVHVFDAGGGVRLVGVTRSIQLNQEGTGGTETIDNTAFEKTESVKIVLGRPVHVYDQRAGKYLGRMESHAMDLDPWSPPIFVLTEEKLPAIAARVEPGEKAVVTVTSEQPAIARAVRVEVRSPEGKLLRHYSGNILVKGGKAQWQVPFALNDAAGEYKVTCKDVLTGQVVVLTVERAAVAPVAAK